MTDTVTHLIIIINVVSFNKEKLLKLEMFNVYGRSVSVIIYVTVHNFKLFSVICCNLVRIINTDIL